jgi:hypothetical protein
MKLLVLAAAVGVISWTLIWLSRRRLALQTSGRETGASRAHSGSNRERHQRGFIRTGKEKSRQRDKDHPARPDKSGGPRGPIKKPWGW